MERSEQKWILCSDRLPLKSYEYYLVTCKSNIDDRKNWVIKLVYTVEDGWINVPPMLAKKWAEIIAWMPIPEPYCVE